MQRTQIYLDPEMASSLDRLAQERRTSRAEIIREAARRYISTEFVPGVRCTARFWTWLDWDTVDQETYPSATMTT